MAKHALIVGLLVGAAGVARSLAQVPSDIDMTRPALLSPAGEFPAVISLPIGFGPEGIAAGNGTTFYVGSLDATTLGQILAGDLRTGELWQLVPPTGRPALGMKYDRRTNLLFVAGGVSGRGTIYDASSGSQIAFYTFQPPSPAPPAARTTNINTSSSRTVRRTSRMP